MGYLKLLAISALILAVTAACDPPDRGEFECIGPAGSEVCVQKYKVFEWWRILGETPGSAVGIMSTFNAGDFTVDLSSSNIPVTTTSGYATVVIDLSNGSRQSRSFEWIRLGDEAVVANPSAVNAWIQPKLAGADAIDVEFDFEVESAEGVNLVVTELKHQGTMIAGSSDSWYAGGNGGCGGSCETN